MDDYGLFDSEVTPSDEVAPEVPHTLSAEVENERNDVCDAGGPGVGDLHHPDNFGSGVLGDEIICAADSPDAQPDTERIEPALLNPENPTPTADLQDSGDPIPTKIDATDMISNDFLWFESMDGILTEGCNLNVRPVSGQDFQEFTARVIAASSDTEAEDEFPELADRVRHYRRVGVNPLPAQSSAPTPRQGSR
jgi:hypothetical protein